MSKHLTRGQKALLEAGLIERQQQLDLRLAEHTPGQTRAEHARDVLLQDGDDAPQRENDREMDLAQTERETQELGLVGDALRRLQGDDYGVCTDCGTGIPFDRLKVEAWARRCVACETARERGHRH